MTSARCPACCIGQERRVYGDSAYASQKELIRGKAPRAKNFTNERVRNAGQVNEVKRAKNHSRSEIRARVEHVFALVKRLWGFTKVRYRGFASITASKAKPGHFAVICKTYLGGHFTIGHCHWQQCPLPLPPPLACPCSHSPNTHPPTPLQYPASFAQPLPA